MSDQDKITGYGPKTNGTYWVEFRTANGRVHRAMLRFTDSTFERPRGCQARSRRSCRVMRTSSPV